MKKSIIFLGLAIALYSCTDAQRGEISSLEDSASVKCYSGTAIIYEGLSTGKVSSESQSDGYYFRDKKTGKMMEVSGNCIIIYDP